MLDDFFSIDVDGVGTFRFRRRTVGDAIWIENRMVKILGTSDPGNPGLMLAARQVADLERLVVGAPDEWSIEEMDPFDTETFDTLGTVWEAFREAEKTFLAERRKKRALARVGA